MEFVVEPEIFARYPGLRIAVATAHGLDNATPRPAVAAAWRETWAAATTAAAAYGNAQSHPRVRPWRERSRALGVSPKDYPSSIEALLRRALKGGQPFTINPLVDFYNSVSLRHVVPAGGFDLGALTGPLALRLSRAGDGFTALDAAAPAPVPPGEVSYADGETILTRHFVWRQARDGLIGPATRSVVLIAEVLGELEEALVATVLADLAAGLGDGFGVTPTTAIVDEAYPALRLPPA